MILFKYSLTMELKLYIWSVGFKEREKEFHYNEICYEKTSSHRVILPKAIL